MLRRELSFDLWHDKPMKILKSLLKTRACSLVAALMLPLAVWAAPIDDYFNAIKNDNDGAVVTILFRGFDANTLDSDGRHGLHIAMMEGSLKVAKTLLDLSGTKVDTLSKQDETPLMIAALKGYTAFAKRMIARGADVNKTGWAPLHYAATGGHLDMIKLLIEENAYIDTESPNQSTPLMLAAMYGTDAAVKLLLQEGADASIKNQQGMNAADFAAKVERMDLARFLDKQANEGVNPKTSDPSDKKAVPTPSVEPQSAVNPSKTNATVNVASTNIPANTSANTSANVIPPKTSTTMTRKPLADPSYAAKAELAPNGRIYAAINYGNPILAFKNPTTGEPMGVSVDLSRELARRLGASVQLVTFDAAGKVVEALKAGSLDIAFLAIDPARAVDISYSAPYVVIEGAYLVEQNSPIRSNEEVDRPGIRVTVGAGSAYDLYLTREIKQAKLVRAPTSQAVVDTFLTQKLEVAAGVKQQLEADAKRLPGLRLLDGRFMVINQAMGTTKGRDAGAAYLRDFVEEMKASGFVAQALARHKIEGAAVASISP
jgi:polar amino acid transport system substrate-binding protein